MLGSADRSIALREGRRLRALGAPALGLALVALALGGCDDDADGEREPGAEPAAYDVPQLELSDLGPCGELPKRGGFRCGRIEVPFEREDASYGMTTIGFGVRPAGGGAKLSNPPIFAVEGGPGYSSTGSAAAYRAVFGPELMREHDLVLVDMRGTGRSQPGDCPNVQRAFGPDFVSVGECARRLGKRFESYRTAAAADDIDDVRTALGYGNIALYGDSYGTFLAQSYAFRHGETLDALVLDSAYPAYGEDPWYPSLVRTGTRAMKTACEREPTCPGGAEGASARMEEMAEALRKGRRDVGLLVDAIVNSFGGPPDSFLEVDAAIRDFLAGDKSVYDDLNAPLTSGARRIRQYSRTGELVVGCNDYPMIWDNEASEPERRAQLEQAIRDYDPDAFPPFTPREVAYAPDFGYLECLTWPAPTGLYEPPVDPETDEPTKAPVLVVSGEMDSITTPWEGKQVAKEFPDSEQYIARNAGHVDALYYVGGPAAREIRAFLTEQIGG